MMLSHFNPDVAAADVELTPEQVAGFLVSTPRMPRGNKDMGIGTHKLGPCKCGKCTACRARKAHA